MVILLVRNLFVLSRDLHFKRSKSMSLKKPENFKRLIFQNFSNFRQTEYIFFEKNSDWLFRESESVRHTASRTFSLVTKVCQWIRDAWGHPVRTKKILLKSPAAGFWENLHFMFPASFPTWPCDKNYKRTFAQGSLRTAEGLGNSQVCYGGLLNFPLLFSTFYTYGLERKQNVKLIFQNSKPVSTDRFATRPRGTLMVEYLHSSRRYATVMLRTGM